MKRGSTALGCTTIEEDELQQRILFWGLDLSCWMRSEFDSGRVPTTNVIRSNEFSLSNRHRLYGQALS